MVVGILQVEISLSWAGSLKDKRSVIQSLKAKLHREHQVSVAEVGLLDDCQAGMLGIVLAAGEVPRAQSVLDKVLKKIEDHPDCVVSQHRIEILSGY